MIGFEPDLGLEYLGDKGKCRIAAMRLMHSYRKYLTRVDFNSLKGQAFSRLRCAMISSVTKSRKAAMRWDWRNSSG
ncbi:hypothetical protein SAMN04488527_10281 [Aliiroseovarius crassostreae]|nr:hypothetical protein SAMN04488527_10281 [Aliiroseovarius crassostreae]